MPQQHHSTHPRNRKGKAMVGRKKATNYPVVMHEHVCIDAITRRILRQHYRAGEGGTKSFSEWVRRFGTATLAKLCENGRKGLRTSDIKSGKAYYRDPKKRGRSSRRVMGFFTNFGSRTRRLRFEVVARKRIVRQGTSTVAAFARWADGEGTE